MEYNRMLGVAEEAIINLLLHLNPHYIVNFFKPKAYPEFNYLLDDKYFLHKLSIYNEVPNISDLKDLINYTNMGINKRLNVAARNGDLDGAIRMLRLRANNYDSAMIDAARNGHINVVKLMLEYGANDYNRAMRQASCYGNIEIVKLMLNLGANNYKQAAYCANIDVVKLLLEYMEPSINTYNEIMEAGANGGKLDVVDLMSSLGADDFDTAISAVYYGGAGSSSIRETIQYLKELKRSKGL